MNDSKISVNLTRNFDPTFFENSTGWFWYDRGRAAITTNGDHYRSYPTHGPFHIEALARKDCTFWFNKYESR